MKLPTVAIATAFALGIAFGLSGRVAGHASNKIFLASLFLAAATSLLAGFFLSHFTKIAAAGTASLLGWMLLGSAAAIIDQQPRASDHVLNLVATGKINLKSPLRYYGKLRDEPEKLPWGTGYEIELSAVSSAIAPQDLETENPVLPTSGGLRLSFTLGPIEETSLATLHAGDSISVLTQAKLPESYRDEGAFDRRAYLAEQGVHLTAALRTPELLQVVEPARASIPIWIATIRRRLREEIDVLCSDTLGVAGVLRAMLLGDRNFVDREEAQDFQKTGTFHVLVVAGLHVGAMAMVLFWVGRKLRLPRAWTVGLTLALLLAYVAVVQQRAPVLRAALMAGLVVTGGLFYRQLELLNSAALAGLLLLIARPLSLRDPSFQLSFLAIGCIGGLAIPFLRSTVLPYGHALRGWRDITRDPSYEPRHTQFRLDLRSFAGYFESRWPGGIGKFVSFSTVQGLGFSFRMLELFMLTMVLQIGMLPVLAGQFHRITFAGPLVNFAAVPMTAVIVPLGFLTVLSGFLWPALAKILALPLSWTTLALIHVVQQFAHVRQLSYRVPGPAEWISLCFFVALLAIAACSRAQFPAKKKVMLCFCGLLSATSLLIVLGPFAPRFTPGKLEVTMLDVGQGDSLLVVSPMGRTLLIDGGGAFAGFPGRREAQGSDPGEEAVSPYLWSRGFKNMDVVALTHAHQDHLGGLNAVLENFRVGRLWIGREVNSPALAKLENTAREKHIPVEYESRGKSFSMDGVEGEFLWPEISEADPRAPAKNNDSLVLRLKYGNQTLLLPGDAEKQVERTMLRESSGSDLRADVLKVGHHGSKNSTTEEFLHAVEPKVAIISAGDDNPYGHPSPELLERLTVEGARILRTDRDGAIHILTDGQTLEVSCFVACPETALVAASGGAQPPNQNQNR